jgi:hypothetical protein
VFEFPVSRLSGVRGAFLRLFVSSFPPKMGVLARKKCPIFLFFDKREKATKSKHIQIILPHCAESQVAI